MTLRKNQQKYLVFGEKLIHTMSNFFVGFFSVIFWSNRNIKPKHICLYPTFTVILYFLFHSLDFFKS